MATITATTVSGSGAQNVTLTTGTASDTFTYEPGKNQKLWILNDTAGALTPNIDGDGQTSVNVAGIGSVDVSAGYDWPSIGIDEVDFVRLDTIKEFCTGTITLTGADDAKLWITQE